MVLGVIKVRSSNESSYSNLSSIGGIASCIGTIVKRLFKSLICKSLIFNVVMSLYQINRMSSCSDAGSASLPQARKKSLKTF